MVYESLMERLDEQLARGSALMVGVDLTRAYMGNWVRWYVIGCMRGCVVTEGSLLVYEKLCYDDNWQVHLIRVDLKRAYMGDREVDSSRVSSRDVLM